MCTHYQALKDKEKFLKSFNVEPPASLGKWDMWPLYSGCFIRVPREIDSGDEAVPTREAIDPVRFLSNHSTGKMGVAMADEAFKRGANVTLILGKGADSVPHKNYDIKYVDSASELLGSCQIKFASSHIFIMAAAVADYTPVYVSESKIKKKAEGFVIELKPTVDILATLGKTKTQNQLLVGFALETNDELKHAQDKLKQKNLDLIILNSLREPGAGFATETNKITIVGKDNTVVEFSLKSKKEVAVDILNYIETKLHK